MPEAQQEEAQGSWFRTILNGVTIFFAINAVSTFIGGRLGSQKTEVTDPTGNVKPAANVQGAAQVPALWPLGTMMDMRIYLDEDIFPTFEDEHLVFWERSIELGDYKESHKVSVDVPISKKVQNNGTLFAHIFVSQSGATPNPTDPAFDPELSYHSVKLLSRYMPKKKEVHLKNLISGDEDGKFEPEIQESKTKTIVSYWHSNLTIGIISDNKPVQLTAMPEPMAKHIRLFMKDGERYYYPIVYPNDFWLLKDHMQEINSTVTSLPLHIEIYPTSFWKFQIFSSMDDSFKKQQDNPGPLGQTSSGGEIDEFKKMLIDTNPILLVTTFLVSMLHSLFEFLAFKNDIVHWRSKKDNTGVSFRTIISNVVMQTIIFLYLLDQSENTSWLIMAGQGFGILLEMWKVTKTVNVRVQRTNGIIPFRILFEDKHVLTETEAETQEYDKIAFTYMYWGGIPLLLAYAVYSLMYDVHKSWYSYIVTTLVGFVYFWGFLMMVPALYINYRLRSVAHMPRRTMVYKFLNTIVDDLFSFCISMPTLHRLACFRDDVIFVIYLYQMYAYKVDKTRVNEYGQGGDDDAAQGTGPTVKPLPVEGEKVKPESKKSK